MLNISKNQYAGDVGVYGENVVLLPTYLLNTQKARSPICCALFVVARKPKLFIFNGVHEGFAV